MALQMAVAVVAGLVGLSFLWAALSTRLPRRPPGVLLQGEVVALIAPPQEDPHVTPAMAPVVAYRSPDGQPRQFTSAVAQYPCPYTIGQAVAVRYDVGRESPAELDDVIDEVDELWVSQLVFGVVFCAVALLIWYLDDVTRWLDARG